MYARAGQFGVVALPDPDPVYVDPMQGEPDGDPRIYLTPSVIDTSGGGTTPAFHVDPVPVDQTMIPQQLPDLIVTAAPPTAQAGLPSWVWIGLAALVAIGLSKGGRGGGTRSW